MVRLLPGVYDSIKDLSLLPEGSGEMVVGLVLKSNKGPTGTTTLQNSTQDLLTNYTYYGTVKPTDDKAFHTAKEILKYTTQLYISRASKNALYGGLIVKKEDLLGNITQIVSSTKTIYVSGDCSSLVSPTDTMRVYGVSTTINGRYTVSTVTYENSTNRTAIVVTETVTANYSYSSGTYPKAYKTRQSIPFNQQLLGAISGVDITSDYFSVAGDQTNFFPAGDKILVSQSTGNNGTYIVDSATYVNSQDRTDVYVTTDIPDDTTDGNIYRDSIVNPTAYEFKSDDLFIITGKDEGAYNGLIEYEIVSSTETPESVTETNSIQITIYDSTTNEQLELPYIVNRDQESKATDGTPLYIEDVINDNSAFIKVVNNTSVTNTELPCDTLVSVQASGGSDGDTLTDADIVNALSVFEDKLIPLDIVTNGSTETETYQKALVALAEGRKDIFVFLNSRLVDEQPTTNSAKATAIVNYKKNSVASTSFYAAMYAPHIKIQDVWNSREVVVGADTKIVPGWLNIINNLSYPFAFAGYRHGQLPDVSVDWKIGVESGEAVTLNDASVNIIGFDAKQGRYLAFTQNTLQIANSALRNIGGVLNVLDIKKTLRTYLKEYIGLPITTSLREEIIDKVTNYLNGVLSAGRVDNFAFQDVSTATDVSNDTLRYVCSLALTRYLLKLYVTYNIVNQTFDFTILQGNV